METTLETPCVAEVNGMMGGEQKEATNRTLNAIFAQSVEIKGMMEKCLNNTREQNKATEKFTVDMRNEMITLKTLSGALNKKLDDDSRGSDNRDDALAVVKKRKIAGGGGIVEGFPKAFPKWYYEDHGIFWPMKDWEVNLCETGFAEGLKIVPYEWQVDEAMAKVPYEIDISTMTQTNKITKTKRKLLRLCNDTSNEMTSPFPPQHG